MSNIKPLTTEPTKPILYLDYDNLPTPSSVECHNLAGHRFVDIQDSQIDLLRCVDCGKMSALATLLTVAVEGTFQYEKCLGYAHKMDMLSILPKP
jgi:hypothetical protein